MKLLNAVHDGMSNNPAYANPPVVRLASECTLHYKVDMNRIKHAIAALELLFIFPATLFMTSLFVRNLQPQEYEPARTAERIVSWYAARLHLGLWVLLIALPVAALGLGCATIVRSWSADAELRHSARQTLALIRLHLATLVIAAATLTAGGILGIVALHMLAD
jgi:hypothetical protein